MSKDHHEDLSALDKHVQQESIKYLRRRNAFILEAAIGCLMDTETPSGAAKLLRDHADQLEEYG